MTDDLSDWVLRGTTLSKIDPHQHTFLAPGTANACLGLFTSTLLLRSKDLAQEHAHCHPRILAGWGEEQTTWLYLLQPSSPHAVQSLLISLSPHFQAKTPGFLIPSNLSSPAGHTSPHSPIQEFNKHLLSTLRLSFRNTH